MTRKRRVLLFSESDAWLHSLKRDLYDICQICVVRNSAEAVVFLKNNWSDVLICDLEIACDASFVIPWKKTSVFGTEPVYLYCARSIPLTFMVCSCFIL